MIKKLFILLLIANFAHSQNTLSLYASTGAVKPVNVVFDNENNLYCVDDVTWNIVKISNTMQQTNLVTSYFSTPVSQLNYNTFDNCLYIGISKTGGGRIDKITKQGVVTQIVDPNVMSPVYGVVCDASGNVYFSRNNGNIYKYSTSGVFSTVATGVYCTNLALDNQGNLVTYSFSNDGIFKVNIATGVTTLLKSVFFSVKSIVVHPNGDIYYSDGTGNKVFVLPNGSSTATEFISGTTGGIFGLCVKDNFLYVTERESKKIHKTVSVLGVDAFESTSFDFFPNPTSEFLTINSATAINKVSFYDMNGKFLFSENKNFENISLGNLTVGVYFIRINESGKLFKILKK